MQFLAAQNPGEQVLDLLGRVERRHPVDASAAKQVDGVAVRVG